LILAALKNGWSELFSVIMANLTHIVKLHTDCDPFFARALWNKDQRGVDVLLLQKDKAWKIVLKSNDMEAVAKKLQVEENEATTWMREAFMNGGSSKHFFTIYDGDNYLVWKRASDSPESRMRLRLGSFPMTEANDLDAARVEFMDCAVEAAAGKGGKDEALEARHDKLKEELRKCQEALKDMAESKEELETKLYEQFLPILQSKQDKIRELKGMGRVKKENDEDSYGSSTDVDEKTEEA